MSDYINLKDSSYRWEVKGLEKHSGMSRIIQAEMVSQLWQPDTLVVDEPLWKHRLTIYIPEQLNNHLGIMHVNGGISHPTNSIHGVGPSDELEFANLAQLTGSVVIDLKDVPNQFLTFEGEKPRKEDDLVARTWAEFLKKPDACTDCPIHIGMSKAVVRGMDAVQEILKEHSMASDGFILSGGSICSEIPRWLSPTLSPVLWELISQASLFLKLIVGIWMLMVEKS
nr:PhoPQ-activated protein PqaA family protein [Sansalvadorimonas sp. 2012CJ34-2]